MPLHIKQTVAVLAVILCTIFTIPIQVSAQFQPDQESFPKIWGNIGLAFFSFQSLGGERSHLAKYKNGFLSFTAVKYING